MSGLQVDFFRCNKHRGYKGVHPPMAPCLVCWEYYAMKHPDKPMTMGTLATVLTLVESYVLDATKRIEEDTLETLGQLIASRNDRD